MTKREIVLQALKKAKEQPIDVAFVDINMPFLNGLEFIREFKKIQPQALLVVITGYNEFEYARDALRLGGFEYMLKPLMEDRLVISDGRQEDKKQECKENLERFLPVRVPIAGQPAEGLDRVPEVYRNLQEEAADYVHLSPSISAACSVRKCRSPL